MLKLPSQKREELFIWMLVANISFVQVMIGFVPLVVVLALAHFPGYQGPVVIIASTVSMLLTFVLFFLSRERGRRMGRQEFESFSILIESKPPVPEPSADDLQPEDAA